MNRTPPSIEIDTPLKRRFIIALWIDQITVLSHSDYDVFLQNDWKTQLYIRDYDDVFVLQNHWKEQLQIWIYILNINFIYFSDFLLSNYDVFFYTTIEKHTSCSVEFEAISSVN